MLIRTEIASDAAAITSLTQRAFEGTPHSDGLEPSIIEALRSAGDLTVSLVAEADGTLIGHVAISPVEISDGTQGWYGLGPVSVEPSSQRQGVGSQLVLNGLERLVALGAAGCVVLGDPAFYERFGFEARPELAYPGPPAEFFMSRVFKQSRPHGQVRYHDAFDNDAQLVERPLPGAKPYET